MSKLPAISLTTSTICALAFLVVGACFVSSTTHAAWKNVCPAESLCSNSGINDDKFPFNTPFSNGDSLVLKSPRLFSNGSVQVVYMPQDFRVSLTE